MPLGARKPSHCPEPARKTNWDSVQGREHPSTARRRKTSEGNGSSTDETVENPTAFALEEHLEDFLKNPKTCSGSNPLRKTFKTAKLTRTRIRPTPTPMLPSPNQVALHRL
jgi:hypothetical protein